MTWAAVGLAGGAGSLVAAVLVLRVCRSLRQRMTDVAEREAVLADALHDLRTPIAALRALVEAAQANPCDRAEILPRLIALATRMGDIVEDLLTRATLAAGAGPIELQPVRLDQLVHGVVDELPPGEHSVTLSAIDTVVYAHPPLLRRAVQNLLTNAIQHGHQPGKPATVHVMVADARVTVTDDGPGIPPELANARCFQRFRGSPCGTGLGLHIAHWVAQAHHGAIAARNTDTGARFELILTPATAHADESQAGKSATGR